MKFDNETLTLTAQHRRQLRRHVALTARPHLTLRHALRLLPQETKERTLRRVHKRITLALIPGLLTAGARSH